MTELIERKDPGLFRKIGDRIAIKPDSYDQGVWAKILKQEEDAPACKSTMCVAGHTVTFHPGFVRFVDGDEEGYTAAVEIEVDGETRTASIPLLAAEMLDIDRDESADLFSLFWEPAGDGPLHERVRDALYKMADGASAASVERLDSERWTNSRALD